MEEPINEPVSVDLVSDAEKKTVTPWLLKWRGRTYHIKTVGLHSTENKGTTLLHIYSVTDGTTYFKLRFDTETLGWRLLEIADCTV